MFVFIILNVKLENSPDLCHFKNEVLVFDELGDEKENKTSKIKEARIQTCTRGRMLNNTLGSTAYFLTLHIDFKSAITLSLPHLHYFICKTRLFSFFIDCKTIRCDSYTRNPGFIRRVTATAMGHGRSVRVANITQSLLPHLLLTDPCCPASS